MTVRLSGYLSRIVRINQIPSSPGISISVKTTSIGWTLSLSSAPAALEA